MSKDLQASPSVNPFHKPFDPTKDHRVVIPAIQIPSWNVDQAFQKGVARKFLINTWGGLGDQICAEPAIRFGLQAFKKCEISLASRCPSLFSHLQFKEVFDTRETNPKWEDYLVFNTILPPNSLLWEFLSHMISHQVNFPSICMWRSELPMKDREIILPDYSITDNILTAVSMSHRGVVLHPGKHWKSKTFSPEYWKAIEKAFIDCGFTPIIIGQHVDENVGYVPFQADEKSLDLRDRLDIKEFIALLKNCKYLFSNDSAPVHAASAGDAYIGVVATCKHPDFILHWRKGEFSYKAKNYGRDGVWNHIDYSPAQEEEVVVESLPAGLMEAILPNPVDVAEDFANRREQFLKQVGE